jgi:hypothetical protein
MILIAGRKTSVNRPAIFLKNIAENRAFQKQKKDRFFDHQKK